MFKVELNGKTYKVEKVTAKALREIGAAQAVFKVAPPTGSVD